MVKQSTKTSALKVDGNINWYSLFVWYNLRLTRRQ